MTKREEPYNVGLDIGSSSVGWAVVDNNYHLLNIKKNNLWGARLFKEAETAQVTRGHRSMRRRYRRRRNRLNWLDELFADELAKIDPSFLLRMKNSWVSKKESTRKRDPYNLFIDEKYNDVDYFNQYPTIFHLRKELITEDKKVDIRLIYLAIHNIIKYRGNFTLENQNFDISQLSSNFSQQISDFFALFSDFGVIMPEDFDPDKISDILLNPNLSPSGKVSEAIATISPKTNVKAKIKIILLLLVGNNGDLKKLFDLETTEKIAVKLSSRHIDSELPIVLSELNEQQENIITIANSIFGSIILKDFLGDETSISAAKVISFEDHKQDLQELKTMWRETSNKEAVKAGKKAYEDYIGHEDSETFYKKIKKFLEKAQPVDLANKALAEIELENYLPKQRNRNNTVIPYQLNENELIAILDHQEKYYPFLKENRDKILSLLTFRIPYYVGPLQDSNNNRFSWMTRKASGAIRPWNFSEKVNVEQSSNDFIKRMRSTDTYLIGEPVLPKKSLIYQCYEVLSELNNTRVKDGSSNPKRLDVTIKQRIYNEIFKNQKSVSVKVLQNWLIKESYFKSPEISGLADKKKYLSSLSTYIDFKKIFGQRFVDDPVNSPQLEELAEWLTLFEDKKILLIKLQNSKYSYDQATINKLSTMRYQGTGKLSKKLLVDLKTTKKSIGKSGAESLSILDLMWSTKDNFMQIIHDADYTFEQQIKEFNYDTEDELTPLEKVANLHGSPALKRGLNQSIKVVADIVKFMGHDPEKIFIEFTRSDDFSKLTISRYRRIKKQYLEIAKAIKKIPAEFKDIKEYQTQLEENKGKLASERLMLYFLQCGHSLYSNKPIDLNMINSSKYHVDHILPQSYIKDDSLENKALVLASENENKIDNMLISHDIIATNLPRWQALKDQNLMGSKKFADLTRTTVTENQKKGFIQRQLVQTSQIVKNITLILNDLYKNTSCIETRATLSSEFRKAFSNFDETTYHYQFPEFVKNRDVNDFHHAQDAFLACVIGEYQLKKYPKDNLRLVYDQYSKFLDSLKKDTRKKNGRMPRYTQNGFIIGSMFNGKTYVDDNGEIIWDQKIKESIRKTFNYHQFNVVRQTIEQHGKLFNDTIQPHSDRYKLIPLKTNRDPAIYGGYNNDNNAYSVVLDVDGKKKINGIPIRIANQLKSDELDLSSWLENNIKHKKPMTILIDKVPKYQRIINEETGDLLITSANEVINNVQLFLPSMYTALISLLDSTKTEMYSKLLSNYEANILIDIYDYLLTKLKNNYPLYQKEWAKLAEHRDDFIESDLVTQASTLQQLIKFMHADPSNVNLKFGNFKGNRFGRKNGNIKLSKTDFIYESPTGLFKSIKHID